MSQVHTKVSTGVCQEREHPFGFRILFWDRFCHFAESGGAVVHRTRVNLFLIIRPSMTIPTGRGTPEHSNYPSAQLTSCALRHLRPKLISGRHVRRCRIFQAHEVSFSLVPIPDSVHHYLAQRRSQAKPDIRINPCSSYDHLHRKFSGQRRSYGGISITIAVSCAVSSGRSAR